MKQLQKSIVPMIALVFLLAAAPVKAEDEVGSHCKPCAECHPDTFWCLQCAERVMKALGNCCGSGEGTAYCHADEGFEVTCENREGVCHCNSEGVGCDAIIVGG
jgi:hypothetical protein